MGGEPTFVSIDNMDGAQWNTEALGEEKQQLAEKLIRRLKDEWVSGGLLHYGQGKWYPGESLPRWALGCYWRKDGKPIWKDSHYLADVAKDHELWGSRMQKNSLKPWLILWSKPPLHP